MRLHSIFLPRVEYHPKVEDHLFNIFWKNGGKGQQDRERGWLVFWSLNSFNKRWGEKAFDTDDIIMQHVYFWTNIWARNLYTSRTLARLQILVHNSSCLVTFKYRRKENICYKLYCIMICSFWVKKDIRIYQIKKFGGQNLARDIFLDIQYCYASH